MNLEYKQLSCSFLTQSRRNNSLIIRFNFQIENNFLGLSLRKQVLVCCHSVAHKENQHKKNEQTLTLFNNCFSIQFNFRKIELKNWNTLICITSNSRNREVNTRFWTTWEVAAVRSTRQSDFRVIQDTPFPTWVTWLCFHLVAVAAENRQLVRLPHGAEFAAETLTEQLQILQRLILNYSHYQFVAAGKHLQFHMVLIWGPQFCPEALWEPQDIKNMSVTTLVSVPFEAVFPPQTLCHLRSLCPSLRISLCVMGPWHQAQASCNPRGSAVCWMSRRESQMHLKVLKSHHLSKKYLFMKLYFFK